jgi:osmotically-inducible protein OsmY
MKSDLQLKKMVCADLAWCQSIDTSQVQVAVRAGVVTLSGRVRTYADQYAIAQAVRRVAGVEAVVSELDVKLDSDHVRSDAEITAAAEALFTHDSLIPPGRVTVTVDKGWVTLSGELDQEYQRREAEQEVRTLTGVLGIRNAVGVRAAAAPVDGAAEARLPGAMGQKF